MNLLNFSMQTYFILYVNQSLSSAIIGIPQDGVDDGLEAVGVDAHVHVDFLAACSNILSLPWRDRIR